jgi:hypothetical protein
MIFSMAVSAVKKRVEKPSGPGHLSIGMLLILLGENAIKNSHAHILPL